MSYRNMEINSKEQFLRDRVQIRLRRQVESEMFEKWSQNKAIICLAPIPGDSEEEFKAAANLVIADYRGKGFTIDEDDTGVFINLTIS